MKKYALLGLVIIFLGLGAGCENKLTLSPSVDKQDLIQYCEDNGGYIGETDGFVCYFFNSSCPALDFYNGDCLPQDVSQSLYDEETAKTYCEKQYGTVNELEIGGETEKICFFPNQSVCSLKDLFNGECNYKAE